MTAHPNHARFNRFEIDYLISVRDFIQKSKEPVGICETISRILSSKHKYVNTFNLNRAVYTLYGKDRFDLDGRRHHLGIYCFSSNYHRVEFLNEIISNHAYHSDRY